MKLAYDYDCRRLNYRIVTGQFVDLELHGTKVVVVGDSAVGKTYIFDSILDNKANERSNTVITKASKSFRNIFCVNILNDNLMYILSVLKNCLVIIDNGELVLTKELSNYINSDRDNHYLIFSRGACDLRITPNNFANLCFVDNCFKLSYEFNEIGW